MPSLSIQMKPESKSYMGRSFYDQDFSGQSFIRADCRRGTFFNCKFDGADLSYANFSEANLYCCSFNGAKLYHTNLTDAVLAGAKMDPRDMMGLKISLSCNTFDKVVISKRNVMQYLFLISLMSMDEDIKKGILAIIGEERVKTFERVFRVRVI